MLCAVAGWTRGAVPGAACGLAHCPVPLSAGQAFPEGAAGWGGEGVGRGGLLRDSQAPGVPHPSHLALQVPWEFSAPSL